MPTRKKKQSTEHHCAHCCPQSTCQCPLGLKRDPDSPETIARRILANKYMDPQKPPPDHMLRLVALVMDVRALCEYVTAHPMTRADQEHRG